MFFLQNFTKIRKIKLEREYAITVFSISEKELSNFKRNKLKKKIINIYENLWSKSEFYRRKDTHANVQ
jgi:ferredoxin-fold anticodon binding domain-containing protein